MPEEHSSLGYSAINDFDACPLKYKLKYIDKIKTIPSDDPQNALNLGTALHRGIETDAETAIEEYFASYNVIDDRHIIEAMKIEWLVGEAKKILPEGRHEVFVKSSHWCGTIDLLAPISIDLYGKDHICDECEKSNCDDSYSGHCPYGKFEKLSEDTFDIYDFKYSNNKEHYLDSRQLHLYKFYAEKVLGIKIRNLNFVFFPKVLFRQKKTETIQDFRKRTMKELTSKNIEIVTVEYEPNKVIEHLELTQDALTESEFEKTPNYFCNWCEYNNYCMKGNETDMLPSTNRIDVTINEHKKIWIYGEPFSGKTHLANEAPEPILELNTDGNVRQYTMPRISIKDEVTVDGRQTKRKYAWEVFKSAIDDLEKGAEFKTIVVDLLEDVYDSCRKCVCDGKGWEHESDDSFKAYDIVRTEFLREMKRLLNLPYNVILISHLDMSKDIMKKSGDKVTRIAPNITEKIANKIAGMVDVVVRAIKDGDDYTISTKTSNVIFGGGRLDGMRAEDVPNEWKSIESMYGNKTKNTVKKEEAVSPFTASDIPFDVEKSTDDNVLEELKKTYTEESKEEVKVDEIPTEPVRRTRRTRA